MDGSGQRRKERREGGSRETTGGSRDVGDVTWRHGMMRDSLGEVGDA